MRESFQFFTVKYDVSCEFGLYGSLYYAQTCSLYAKFDGKMFYTSLWFPSSSDFFSWLWKAIENKDH